MLLRRKIWITMFCRKRVDVTDSLSVREINSPRVITNKLEEVHPEVGSAKRKTSFENQGGQNTSLVGMLHSEVPYANYYVL